VIYNERPEPNERVQRLDCELCHGSGRYEYHDASPQSFWDFCQGCEGRGKRMTDETKPWGDEWLICGETEGNGIK
jgi:DnaJ-class molecular chaperone